MNTNFGPKRFLVLLLLLLFIYLSLYTWNLKTGVLDELASQTGLEFTALVLKPGKWLHAESVELWERYVYLVGLKQENDELREELDDMRIEMWRLREQAERTERLERLLHFEPPQNWLRQGARVIAHQMGPAGSLQTIMIDKGEVDDIAIDAPVLTPEGTVGRVMRTSLSSAVILLLSDPNSRIAVRGRESRTTGILTGQGEGELLALHYVPLNAPLREGEILVTSGLADIFPRGLPTARVVAIERSNISLFQRVLAEPLVDVTRLEEVLVLARMEPPPIEAGTGFIPDSYKVQPEAAPPNSEEPEAATEAAD
jgi:rod shape-determining protein MreC